MQGPSLNDCIEKGLTLTTPLYDILMRFRTKNIAFVADIEKAFLNISLHLEHRDYVRFIWFQDINNTENNKLVESVEYRLCRVLFFVTASPFLLQATLLFTLTCIYNPSQKLMAKRQNLRESSIS